VASFSQLDADRKVRPKRIYLNRLQQLEKYGDNVRRTVPCTVAIRSAAKSCLLARPRLPAGDRAGCWVPRQLSETRSATAVNGSQLARWLCSLLSLAWHLSHRRFAPSRTHPSPKAAVAYVCGEGANIESLARQACEHSVVDMALILLHGCSPAHSSPAPYRPILPRRYTNRPFVML